MSATHSKVRLGFTHARLTLFGVLVLSAGPLLAAGQRLTLDAIYHPDREQRVEFAKPRPRVTWLDGERFLLERREDDKTELGLGTVGAERERPFFDRALFEEALTAVPGLSADDAKRMASSALHWSEDHSAVLINHANDLFYYRFGDDRARRLTFDDAPEVGEELSPDGQFVSYVRDHDLFLLELESGRARPLTSGGNDDLFFGRLDWVYQEEVYGRGNFKGYWWSPDSRRIAFLKLDEAPVREFTVVDHIPDDLRLEVTNYPLAGAPNPSVELGVLPVLGGEAVWVDTSMYAAEEHLIVRVGWTPDAAQVVIQVQDREQTWLDLALADPKTGDLTTLFRETSPAFVNVTGEPEWLDDGSFLWLSERTGFQHIYRYEADGKLRGQLTEGEWEVRSLYGVDEEHGQVYFAAMEHSAIAPHIYRVALTGGAPERLSRDEGSHSAAFSTDYAYYVDTRSDATTPPVVRLHRADGRVLREIADTDTGALGEYELGTVEHLKVPAGDGYPMEAMLIKPPDFDPTKKYPVLQYNYGGPHAPVVRDAWGGSRYLWHQLLAQRGYVIWMCDNRSASGKGIEGTWEAYRKMGVVELRDIEDGLAWLRRQSWVDPERLGIWGWSYGGFMASFALTHSKSFKMGIAGAPVTDWRLYDSIYTERYMKRPQSNREGYDETSVVKAAKDLHGKLLILHGTIDDNVHFQNTVQLVYELQKAGKQFELMIYPRSRHGVRDRKLVRHLQQVMTDFVLENL